jgi:hypothetical protein
MELILLGWALGLATGMAHHRFVVKPELEKAIAELRHITYDLEEK